MTGTRSPSRLRRLCARLWHDRGAATVVEMAVSMPLLMGLALVGTDVVNLAILHMRLNQLAITVADNASRAKQASATGAPQFREYDVNQVFTGASLSVEDLDFPNNGRVIVSSLEQNASTGQWIHWQRCWGKNTWVSRYGVQGTGATGTGFAGMGQTTVPMQAEANSAIMFVEVAYNYSPMFLNGVVTGTVIRKEAALYVRDDRDLAKGVVATAGLAAATC
ncbi:MAG: hypothetical protein B7Z39_01545 [Novosphingobium sp. 12-64-8]|nr:MAG: hypothetical protein B7Z39_01545 [Novosphingobium sp. 12-64-8]